MRDIRTLAVFSTAAILQAGDVLSTKYALAHGAIEANPTAAPYVHLPIAVLLLIKVGLCAVGYAVYRHTERRYVHRAGKRPHSAVYLPLLCILGVYAYVITSNLHLGGLL